MEGKIRKRPVKGWCVIGLFARIIRRRNVSMEVERVNTNVWISDLDMK